MGIGVGIALLAIGAILTFAVQVEAEGININTVGIILMVVGTLGILLSLLFWESWGGTGIRRTTIRRERIGDTVVEDRRDDVV